MFGVLLHPFSIDCRSINRSNLPALLSGFIGQIWHTWQLSLQKIARMQLFLGLTGIACLFGIVNPDPRALKLSLPYSKNYS